VLAAVTPDIAADVAADFDEHEFGRSWFANQICHREGAQSDGGATGAPLLLQLPTLIFVTETAGE